MLRKPVSVRNTNIVIDTTFRTDLSLAYESFGYHASLINKPCNFYKSASYISDEIQCHLNIDDVVTIQVADYGESYAVIKGIFKHKSNDGYFFSLSTLIGLKVPSRIMTNWIVQSLSFVMIIFIAGFFC